MDDRVLKCQKSWSCGEQKRRRREFLEMRIEAKWSRSNQRDCRNRSRFCGRNAQLPQTTIENGEKVIVRDCFFSSSSFFLRPMRVFTVYRYYYDGSREDIGGYMKLCSPAAVSCFSIGSDRKRSRERRRNGRISGSNKMRNEAMEGSSQRDVEKGKK